MGFASTILKTLGLRSRKVTFFLFQIQDLDMLLPIMKRLKSCGADIEALLYPFILKNSPRVKATLESEGISYLEFMTNRGQIVRYISSVSALVTAADTNAAAHQPGHKVAKLANWLGVRTFTLQHGLENIGLTYFDNDFPPEQVTFASRTIFTWCSEAVLDPRVPKITKRRCVPTGCPKDYLADSIPDVKLPFSTKRLVVVFENLHWGRYTDSYRELFMRDLGEVAKMNPATTILVKPHHAGRWLSKNYSGQFDSLTNLVIAHPTDPAWEPYTGPSLIKVASGVITTPSTIAFDAAVMQKPVAVIGYDLDLPVYQPLPILRDAQSWNSFVRSVANLEFSDSVLQRAIAFRDRASVPKPAAEEIANHIANTM